jgi:hypothetical protein
VYIGEAHVLDHAARDDEGRVVVRVHQPRHDEAAPRVDPRARGEARPGAGRRLHGDDAIRGDRDGAVGDDAIGVVEGEDETAARPHGSARAGGLAAAVRPPDLLPGTLGCPSRAARTSPRSISNSTRRWLAAIRSESHVATRLYREMHMRFWLEQAKLCWW